ncbi:DUF1772-domain-containing protein [Daedalea quercina L-15889]|uniref:DUF1772-domain-containing protein n=1 Tax=Daedalea quercina L-15889 TaxID=1314783 RepID=A0A165QBY9_9APHY|nr:DUF1772-domain-containing protein [Daedalea quercina L-15889]
MSLAAGFTGVHIAQLVGIGSSGYLAGFVSAASILGVPPLYFAPPEVATKQWAKIYHTGAAIVPATAATSFLAYLYLSYNSGHTVSPAEGYAYLAAGALTLAVAPYTLLTMMTTNRAIEAIAESKDAAAQGDQVTSLIQKWNKLNLGRASGPIIGFGIGLLALGGFFA